MVSWYLLIIAVEVGVFIGFIVTAAIVFSQIKKLNANILNHHPHQTQNKSLLLPPDSKEKE